MLEPYDPESKFKETQIEVPDELYDRYINIMKQFDELQTELLKLYHPRSTKRQVSPPHSIAASPDVAMPCHQVKNMKTSKLTGAALDWAVAEACNEPGREILMGRFSQKPYVQIQVLDKYGDPEGTTQYEPSTDWAQGGPIIEREKIHLFQQEILEPEWTASLPREHKVGWRLIQYGPTPLIAAMRCYVASKLGDEVELPTTLNSPS